MKKKILILCILSMFLLSSFNTISVEVTTNEIEENDSLPPLMHANTKFLDRYENDYNSEEEAYIDPNLISEIQETTDFSILDLLYYIPEDRDQGRCSNCWAWPSTSVLEIALRVQKGVMLNRLSVQFMNTCGELYPMTRIECCEGGTIGMLASFYRSTGYAIPWSNENAWYRDGRLLGQCTLECDEIGKDPNYPIEDIRSKRIETRNVPEETAIENIKNILHQNRGVYFSVFYADYEDLGNFQDFWREQDEEFVYDLNHYAGHPWNPDEAAGHAMLIVGYHDAEDSDRNDYWVFLNSWGTAPYRPNGLLRVKMHMNYSLKYSSQYAFGAETLNVTFDPQSPLTTVTGPNSGKPDQDYKFNFSATDPQGDDINLYVNWGDKTNTGWIGPYNSGEVIQLNHSFPEQKNYTIKARAEDIYDNLGKEQPFIFRVSKSKIFEKEDFMRLIILFLKYLFFLKIII